jgi:hypothetical protein
LNPHQHTISSSIESHQHRIHSITSASSSNHISISSSIPSVAATSNPQQQQSIMVLPSAKTYINAHNKRPHGGPLVSPPAQITTHTNV